MSGRPRQPPLTQADELRQATRDANAAAKDLRDAIREARQLKEGLLREAAAAIHEGTAAQWDEFVSTIQGHMDNLTNQLRQRVQSAREDIMRALIPAKLYHTDYGFEVKFRGGNFDPGPDLLPLEDGQIPGPILDLRKPPPDKDKIT